MKQDPRRTAVPTLPRRPANVDPGLGPVHPRTQPPEPLSTWFPCFSRKSKSRKGRPNRGGGERKGRKPPDPGDAAPGLLATQPAGPSPSSAGKEKRERECWSGLWVGERRRDEERETSLPPPFCPSPVHHCRSTHRKNTTLTSAQFCWRWFWGKGLSENWYFYVDGLLIDLWINIRW